MELSLKQLISVGASQLLLKLLSRLLTRGSNRAGSNKK